MSLPNREGDWDWARVRYETSDLSCDQIGDEIGVTATAIVSRASRQGWTRNRRETSVERSAELILAQKISKEEEMRARFESIEKVNALMQAEVLTVHRTDIKQARAVCMSLWDDLKEARTNVDPDTSISLQDCSMVMQRLATSMKTLILLERQAFGIAGVIEDPETPNHIPQVPVSVLDSVLDKFAKVLQYRNEKPIPMMKAEVIENGSSR